MPVITLLTGDNGFELKRALETIEATFDGTSEKFDGESLEVAQMPDLLQGGTLFADKRLVIINNLSENKQLWDIFSDWLSRVSDDVHLVLVEPKPDKRTKTYKDLKKQADVREFTAWGDRDTSLAERWVTDEAKRQGVALDKKGVQQLVARVGRDQWGLYHALEKLSVLDSVTTDTIESVIEANPSENVFNLIEAALQGDRVKIHDMIRTLGRDQDPYMTFGLLSGQVFQLAALVTAEKPSSEVAADVGAHPYALSKLVPHAKKIGRNGIRKVAAFFADADSMMKSSAADPWLLIEGALIKTASL